MTRVFVLCALCAVLAGSAGPQVFKIRPALATAPVTDDPDDPAIWVNRADPARSLIIGTNKVKAPAGALVVFGLDGAIRQVVAGLERPNNVDVEYGLVVQGQKVDIAVVTERLKTRLRVYRIAPDGGGITDISALDRLQVFTDRKGEEAAPMGIAIYERDAKTGYIVCSDQIDGESQYHIYRREGAPGNPHDHSELLKIVAGGANSTDGIEVTSVSLGPRFPHGLMVAMNSGPRNFLIYNWDDIASAGSPRLLLASPAQADAGRGR